MNIRLLNLDEDLPAVAGNYSIFERNKTILAEEVGSWLGASFPGRIARMFVAVNETGAIQGHVEICHDPWHTPGLFIVFILVDPRCRGQGIGTALWDATMDFLREHHPTSLVSAVRDDDRASLAFAQRHGFVIERHRFTSNLDLNTFDESPYHAEIARLEQEGLRFCSLADFPENEETTQRFYELSLAVTRDLPGEDWDLSQYLGFFEKFELGSPWFRREGQLLAREGEKWVGFAAVHYNPDTCRAYNANTGVIRPYRGRKIAQALKAKAVGYARTLGAVAVDTENDSLNAPMLAINRKMGYQPQPGKYKLVCQKQG